MILSRAKTRMLRHLEQFSISGIRPYSIDRIRPHAYPCRPSQRGTSASIEIPGAVETAHNTFFSRCHYNETHIPTEQPEACTHAWFPRENGDESRAPGIEATSRQGTGATLAETLITPRPGIPRKKRRQQAQRQTAASDGRAACLIQKPTAASSKRRNEAAI